MTRTTSEDLIAMKLPLRTLLPVTVLVAAVGLAACGSDSKTSTSTTTAKSSSASSSTAPAALNVVKAADVPSVGKVLVTTDGKTVYTLTKDGVAVACTGGCLAAWPPVMLPAGAATANGANDLGVVAVGTGKQVTSKKLPIYTFVQDTAPGEAKGEGLASFGGVWHVVKVGDAAGTGTSSTTGSTGSNGSGY